MYHVILLASFHFFVCIGEDPFMQPDSFQQLTASLPKPWVAESRDWRVPGSMKLQNHMTAERERIAECFEEDYGKDKVARIPSVPPRLIAPDEWIRSVFGRGFIVRQEDALYQSDQCSQGYPNRDYCHYGQIICDCGTRLLEEMEGELYHPYSGFSETVLQPVGSVAYTEHIIRPSGKETCDACNTNEAFLSRRGRDCGLRHLSL